MSSNFDDVGAFHKRFDLESVTHYGPGPRLVSEDLAKFRVQFMQEELDEFIAAWESNDEAGMFDALLDLAYVVFGTAHMFGFPWQEGWDAVQAANMKKVRAGADGSNSKRKSSFDVVKPEGWTAPDINAVLRKAGFPGVTPKCPICGRALDDKSTQCRRKNDLYFTCQQHGTHYKPVDEKRVTNAPSS